ncbi:MAG TPA: DUF3710 domain-containing protein [Mycobacteriales bacterium]|nr:DUF3710 domain-containing protein [Mycobacteriales bacterium]
MALFRRKKDEEPEDAVEAAPAEDVPAAPPAPSRPQGPWDVADAPEDDVQRLDLGGLRVPVPPQTEVRVEVSPEGQVVAATLVRAGSAMQVSAFAAPRSEGIWFEVREEIAGSLREGGGTAQEVDGAWGVELQATVPTDVPGGGRQLLPARFVGVDGPRWFLRAMLTGPAAIDTAAAAELRAALRDVVVVRGSDPMAVRDPLPLRLPKDVQQAAEQAARPQAPQVPERGPEITEVR